MVGGRVRKPTARALQAADLDSLLPDEEEEEPVAARSAKKRKVQQDQDYQDRDNSEGRDEHVIIDGADEAHDYGYRRPPKSPRKPGRGFLEKLQEQPVEIVAHIFSHLEHKDLWNLTRVSNGFRAFVLSPAMESIWIEKEDEIGAPPLDELKLRLTHVQFAHLMYGGICWYCRGKTTAAPQWAYLRLVCAKCYSSKMEKVGELQSAVGYRSRLHPVTQFCIEPIERHRGHAYHDWHRRAPIEQIREFNDMLWRRFPPPSTAKKDSTGRVQFSLEDRNWIYKAGHGRDPDPQLKAVVDKHVWLREARMHDSTLLERFSDKRRYVDKSQEEAIRKQRHADVTRRLRALGWTNEDLGREWWYRAPVEARRAQPLTDERFAYILPVLKQWLVDTKIAREKAERQERERREDRQRLADTLWSSYEEYARERGDVLPLPLNSFMSLRRLHSGWNWPRPPKVLSEHVQLVDSDALNRDAHEMAQKCKRQIVERLRRDVAKFANHGLLKDWYISLPAVLRHDQAALDDEGLLNDVFKSPRLSVAFRNTHATDYSGEFDVPITSFDQNLRTLNFFRDVTFEDKRSNHAMFMFSDPETWISACAVRLGFSTIDPILGPHAERVLERAERVTRAVVPQVQAPGTFLRPPAVPRDEWKCSCGSSMSHVAPLGEPEWWYSDIPTQLTQHLRQIHPEFERDELPQIVLTHFIATDSAQ